MDADSVEYDECSMDHEGNERVEDGCDEHDPFTKKDEDGKD